jgi:hypothetical protein
LRSLLQIRRRLDKVWLEWNASFVAVHSTGNFDQRTIDRLGAPREKPRQTKRKEMRADAFPAAALARHKNAQL